MATIGERFIEALGGVTAIRLQEATDRAYEQGFYDGNDDPATGTFKAGGQGYKRISDNYLREGQIDYGRARATAWALWQRSPIAKRVIRMKRDHIFGTNAAPSSDDAAISELIASFWIDNELDTGAARFVEQLFMLGQQCFPVFVRETDGRVRIGYVDPDSIVTVKKHPENSLKDWAVVTENMDSVTGVMTKRVYRLIMKDESYADDDTAIESRNDGRLVTAEQATRQPWEAVWLADMGLSDYSGSCFLTKVNAVSNQTQGMSDLLQVADWIDQADEVLFALADKERMANYFAWLIQLTGADEAEIRRRTGNFRAPGSGNVYFHNENEQPTLVSPQLNQAGTIETFRAILGLILGGLGFPVHYFGFGDEARGRATADAQQSPTEKSLEHEQSIVKDMYTTMLQFVVDQAIIAKEFPEPDEYEIMLSLPAISTKDMSRVAASLGALAQAFITAEDRELISHETNLKAWAQAMAELDIEVDPAEEAERIAAERDARMIDEEERRNNALTNQMNGNGPPVNGQTMTADELAEMLGLDVEV